MPIPGVQNKGWLIGDVQVLAFEYLCLSVKGKMVTINKTRIPDGRLPQEVYFLKISYF